MLQALPSPYEIYGGGNAFFQDNSNLSDAYDQYLQPLEAVTDPTFRELVTEHWTTMLASAAYGYARNPSLGWALLGGLAGLYFPRTASIVMVADALMQPDGIRDGVVRYVRDL